MQKSTGQHLAPVDTHQLSQPMTTRLTDRLAEMCARHIASTEAAERELKELRQDLHKLMNSADQLLEDLGDCDDQ